MLRLIKLEWSKFNKNIVVRLLFVFFICFLPASLYFGSYLSDLPSFLYDVGGIFKFPAIWENVGYAGNWIVFFFFGVLAIYLVTIEVNNKTMRQSIINGLSRNEFFISKVMSIVLLSLFATLFYGLLVLLIGAINTEGGLSTAFDNDWALTRFFLMSLGYLTFSMMLAFLFRKAGLAVFFYISYIIVIEPLIRLILVKRVELGRITNFFPLNAMEDLMPNPAFRLAENIPNNIDFEFLLSYKEAGITTLTFILLFLSLSYYSFIKRDV